MRFFKTVTWHCLQPASPGNVILIICLLFQSLWGWRHTLTVRGIVQQETCAVTASFPGKHNIKFWRSSFLSYGLLWTDHIPFRTAVFQKVSLADLFCLLHDHLQVHMVFKFSLRVLLKDPPLPRMEERLLDWKGKFMMISFILLGEGGICSEGLLSQNGPLCHHGAISVTTRAIPCWAAKETYLFIWSMFPCCLKGHLVNTNAHLGVWEKVYTRW